jgi:hypothetical protein
MVALDSFLPTLGCGLEMLVTTIMEQWMFENKITYLSEKKYFGKVPFFI